MCILHASYNLPPSEPQPAALAAAPALATRRRRRRHPSRRGCRPTPPSPPPPSPPPLRRRRRRLCRRPRPRRRRRRPRRRSPPPPPNWPPPLPGAPPLSEDKQSRILFYDLTDAELADVRGPRGTAFIPEGAKVLRSGFYKFFDEPFIQAVHFTEKNCPFMLDDGLNSFETNQSRSQVNFDASDANRTAHCTAHLVPRHWPHRPKRCTGARGPARLRAHPAHQGPHDDPARRHVRHRGGGGRAGGGLLTLSRGASWS